MCNVLMKLNVIVSMENHHFILKISRLFSSSFNSCHFRTLPDVAESSISIPKNTTSTNIPHHHHCSSNFMKKPEKLILKSRVPSLLVSEDHTEGTEYCPPLNSKKKEKFFFECKNHSSSSNSGLFSSSDEKFPETETFFSLSSCSGDSFRRQTCRKITRCDDFTMKSIDELGEVRSSARSSLSSSAMINNNNNNNKSTDTVNKGGIHHVPPQPQTTKVCRKTASKTTRPQTELGSDHLSTHLYYNIDSAGITRRRRKTTTARRKTRRVLPGGSSIIGESTLAVEKKSSDPRGDFRASMVEMILEKQMFGAKDLERLLICFLSLNAVSYHNIILDVFSEICETLFSF